MTQAPVAFLFDVDDTLLDNDRFEADLRAWLPGAVGTAGAEAWWHALAERREHLGYVDYLGAVQQCRDAAIARGADDPCWLQVGAFLLDYPFAQRLYPGALDLLATLAQHGPVWLISDGDAVMQPHKLRCAGLWRAVRGQVRIFVHKEQQLAEIVAACPADHYLLIDDKPRILRAVRAAWGKRVSTVLPRQGHYAQAAEPAHGDSGPAADLVVEHIGELAAHPQLRALLARFAA